MCHPYDWTFGSLANPPVSLQDLDQLLSVIMDFVFGSTAGEAGDIGVIAVYQHTCILLVQYGWQDLSWPEDIGCFTGPSVVGIPVQTMDEDDVNSWFCVLGCVNLGQAVPIDRDALPARVALLSIRFPSMHSACTSMSHLPWSIMYTIPTQLHNIPTTNERRPNSNQEKNPAF